MTQYDNLDLTDEECKYPHGVIKKVLDIICAQRNGIVRIGYVKKGYSSYNPKFGGILLKIYDSYYRNICRVVKIKNVDNGKYQLNINKVKEKYDELKKMREEIKVLQTAQNKKLAEDETLSKEIVQGLKGVYVEKVLSEFNIKIYHLTEEEVRKVVEFVKTIIHL